MTGADEPGGPRRGHRPVNQSRRYARRDEPGEFVELTCVTVVLAPQTLAALGELCDQPQVSQADAINRAVRVALLVRRYANKYGVTTVMTSDGRQVDIEVI